MNRKVLLSAQLVESVPGHVTARVVTAISFPCRPLRPVVPSICAHDFRFVGVERLVRAELNGTPGHRSESVWPKRVDGGEKLVQTLPAYVFSEVFDRLEFELDLPRFQAGEGLVLLVTSINPGSRSFACGWIAEDLRDK